MRRALSVMAIILVIAIILLATMTTTGCTRQSDRAAYSVSQEADNFNVMRRLVVLDTRTDTLMFECIGKFSINTDAVDNQLEVVVEREDGKYAKHFVFLSRDTMYVVEDLSGAAVNQFKYEVNYLPQTIVPITFVSKP